MGNNRYFDTNAPVQTPTTIARQQRRAEQAETRATTPPSPANTPASGQITNPSPILPLATERPGFAGASQRQFRGAAPQPLGRPSTEADAFDVYAPPADWRGKQVVANPPPGGNSAPQAVTTVRLGSMAPNPYRYASGQGTPDDYVRWQKANSGSISTRIYDPASSNAPTPNREALLDAAMSPEGKAEAAAIDRQRIEQQYGTEITSERGPATTASESGAGRFPRGNAQPPGMTATAQTTPGSATPAANWQQSVVQKHGAIGKAGSPENAAYVAEYKRRKAAGENFDPVALADEITAQIAQAPASAPKASPAAVAAAPGAGKPAPLSTEADYFTTTPEQDFRDQQAREVAQAVKDTAAAQAQSDARFAPPAGREITPGTTGEIGAPKPRPPKYGTTGDPRRPNRLKLDPYS